MSQETPPSPIALASGLPEADLAADYRVNGRLQIPGVLDEQSADTIHDCLTEFRQWNLVFNQDGQHVDTDAADVAGWSREQRDKLDAVVHAQAETGFQYFYKAAPIYDIYHGGHLPGHFFNEIFEFLNGDAFLTLMRSVTEDSLIAYADAQATCYERGHFLTRHDDDVAGKNRRVAYVLNLSRGWNPDWGGALQFFDERGHIVGGFSPCFNVLNLFSVPASHSVGIVAPFAVGSRYAITGWLRSGGDPMLETRVKNES